MAYVVALTQFEGPMDLLLTLISKAKVDIKDIFISEITEQYLASMGSIHELDMDTASEFLAMAATLLEIKSRALLPRPPVVVEGEESPEEALIRRLTEYKAFKEASDRMHGLEEAAKALFTKLPEEYPLPPPTFELKGLTLEGLAAAFGRILSRVNQQIIEPVQQRHISRDNFTVQECMFRIMSAMKGGVVMFSTLFTEYPSKNEVVSVFMAMLELLRLGHIVVNQDTNYGEIYIEPIRGDAVG